MEIIHESSTSSEMSSEDESVAQTSTTKKKRNKYSLEYKCKVIVQSAGQTTVEMSSRTGNDSVLS